MLFRSVERRTARRSSFYAPQECCPEERPPLGERRAARRSSLSYGEYGAQERPRCVSFGDSNYYHVEEEHRLSPMQREHRRISFEPDPHHSAGVRPIRNPYERREDNRFLQY